MNIHHLTVNSTFEQTWIKVKYPYNIWGAFVFDCTYFNKWALCGVRILLLLAQGFLCVTETWEDPDSLQQQHGADIFCGLDIKFGPTNEVYIERASDSLSVTRSSNPDSRNTIPSALFALFLKHLPRFLPEAENPISLLLSHGNGFGIFESSHGRGDF